MLILLTDVVLTEFLSLLVLTSKDVKTVLPSTLVSQPKHVHCQRKEEPVETTQSSGHMTCLTEDVFVSGSEDAEEMLIDTNHRKSVKEFVLILQDQRLVFFLKLRDPVKEITLPFTLIRRLEDVRSLVTEGVLETRIALIQLKDVNRLVCLNPTQVILVINQSSLVPVEELITNGTTTRILEGVKHSFTEDAEQMETTLTLKVTVEEPVDQLLLENFVFFQRQKDPVLVSTPDGFTTTQMEPVKNLLTQDVKETEIDLLINQVVNRLVIKPESLHRQKFVLSLKKLVLAKQ